MKIESEVKRIERRYVISAATYGSRSANGVIAVTAKRGRIGKPVISFNASTGFQ